MKPLICCPGCQTDLVSSYLDGRRWDNCPIDYSDINRCCFRYSQHFDDPNDRSNLSYIKFSLEKFSVTVNFDLSFGKIIISPYATNRQFQPIHLPGFLLDLSNIPQLQNKLQVYLTFQ